MLKLEALQVDTHLARVEPSVPRQGALREASGRRRSRHHLRAARLARLEEDALMSK